MIKAFQGALEFQENEYEELKELYESLKTKQKPHTLFISCVDSRVVPNLITGTKPGELYVIRNMGNIVPPSELICQEQALSTIASIEYAVVHVGVKNIILCGHSNCGACQAIHKTDNEDRKKAPYVEKWIEFLEPIKEELKLHHQFSHNSAKRMWLTERLNIKHQLKNLLSYEFIKERFLKKELRLYGWHYIIETGEIFNYDPSTHVFKSIKNCQTMIKEIL